MLPILLQIIIVLLVVGVVLWGLTQFPVDPAIMNLIRVAIVVCVALWLIFLLAGIAGVSPYPLRR